MTNEDVSSISAHFSRAGRVADYSDTVLPFNEARRDLVRRTVLDNLRPGSRILEVGCGIGTLTAELAAAGMACTAIDFSAEMIKRAKASIGAAAEVEQTDLFEYKSGQKFAAVIANGVVCYYRDKPRFLGHIAELTEPGGFAAIVHRNMLFNLFALNQGTIDFVSEELLKDLPKLARQRITDELNGISGLSVPTLRDQSAELYRSAENPLDVSHLYADAGFSVSEFATVSSTARHHGCLPLTGYRVRPSSSAAMKTDGKECSLARNSSSSPGVVEELLAIVEEHLGEGTVERFLARFKMTGHLDELKKPMLRGVGEWSPAILNDVDYDRVSGVRLENCAQHPIDVVLSVEFPRTNAEDVFSRFVTNTSHANSLGDFRSFPARYAPILLGPRYFLFHGDGHCFALANLLASLLGRASAADFTVRYTATRERSFVHTFIRADEDGRTAIFDADQKAIFAQGDKNAPYGDDLSIAWPGRRAVVRDCLEAGLAMVVCRADQALFCRNLC